MDLWGAGCVFFEVLTLFPLFPGNNELDQVHRIHDIMGTPKKELLDNFQKHATHMEFDFPQKKGTGIEKMLKHVSKHCVDLLNKMMTYDPDDRITASQALKHPYFKDLRENDIKTVFSTTQPLIYPNTKSSDKDDKSIKLVSKSKKPNKKVNKFSGELEELPPIKSKKEPKKLNVFGKSAMYTKKKKSKFVSPYTKNKKLNNQSK